MKNAFCTQRSAGMRDETAKNGRRRLTVELNSGAGDLLAALRQSRAPVSLRAAEFLSPCAGRISDYMLCSKAPLPGYVSKRAGWGLS